MAVKRKVSRECPRTRVTDALSARGCMFTREEKGTSDIYTFGPAKLQVEIGWIDSANQYCVAAPSFAAEPDQRKWLIFTDPDECADAVLKNLKDIAKNAMRRIITMYVDTVEALGEQRPTNAVVRLARRIRR